MTSYNPPIGHSVAYTFSDDSYKAPIGHSVEFDFTPAPILLDPITFGDGSSILGSMLCGIWAPVQGNQIPLKLKNTWASVDGNKIAFAWNCPYIVVDCPEMWHDYPGDQIDFYFDSKYVDGIPGDNVNFNFNCEGNQPSQDLILGSASGYEGSSLLAGVQETLNIQFFDGSVYVPNIAFINIYLPVEFDVGESFTFEVATLPNFYPQAWDGAAFIADITQSTIPFLSANALEGAETIPFNLWTQINPPVEFDDGAEIVSFDLATRAAITFNAQAQEGSETVASLQTAIGIVATALDGAETFCDLAIITNQGMPAQGFDGAETFLTLYNVPGFILEATDGAEGVADLSASYALSAEGSDGAEFDADITLNPNVPFSVSFYEGAEDVCDLATTMTFSFEQDEGGLLTGNVTFNPAIPWPLTQGWDGAEFTSVLNAGIQNFSFFAYEGAAFVADYTPNPSPSMSFQFWDGSSGVVNVSFAANLGLSNFWDGASVNIPSIDIDPIIFGYEGAETFCDLATENTFPFSIYDGGVGTLDIDLHQSFGLGNFIAWEGGDLQFGALATLVSANLAVRFNAGYVTRADIGSGTDFDLTTDTCCGPRDTTGAYIDIGLAEDPNWHYYGYKQIFTVDLSTRPRFSVNFSDGSEFTSKDYSAYFSFNFFDGAQGSFQTDQFLKIRLCKGNFIPDGDNIVVELTATDNEDCEVNFAYEGATMDCALSPELHMPYAMTEGETMTFDLVLVTAWILNAYEGAELTIHNFPAEMAVNMGDGALGSFTFMPDTWTGADGAIMTCGGLSTDYDVEFLEVGCLDNEFIPTNENGDPEPELAHTVPMELDPFYHEIKARCF